MARQWLNFRPQQLKLNGLSNNWTNRQQRPKRLRFGRECSLVCFFVFVSLYGSVLWKHHQHVKIVQVVENDTFELKQNSNDPTVSVNVVDRISDSSKKRQEGTPKNSRGKFAYAFLLGGAMSTKPGSDHRGGLFSVAVAAHNLRRHNSTADVVLMVQISTLSNATRLPQQQTEVLQRLNIDVIYLPKYADPKFEKFYNLMLEKFRILGLINYDRVLYLDYDVMPRCNLDYVLELSYQGVLKENVVLANLLEPSSGGFFVLAPNGSDLLRLQSTIMEVENRTMHMKFPHWDSATGWGQAFENGDYWITSKGEKGYEWDWYGVQTDQGLLYYWTKYIQRSVSIIVNHSIEQWGSKDGRVWQERIDEGVLQQRSCSAGPKGKAPPYRDFVHLTGRKKPWHSNLSTLEQGIRSKPMEKLSSEELWLWLLKDALASIGMESEVSLDFIKGEVENAALGTTPGNRQRNMLIKNKAKVGWNQYQHNG
ncbi:hypothetical protein IV203_003871 [Nitzschia inconspicua]|uniref:Hexosyltransferase n=1 Tax=Nitzschia inconspicua TaxID=303405 RepID=A0A9K3L2K7_9STRA|nr:hypothetical protein IV203_003871 [Nitzschia inconspicua]